MAITRVGGTSDLSNTATMPTHQDGDLIIVFAYRSGSTTPPSVPPGLAYQSYPGGSTSAGGSSNSARIAYKWARSSSETVGTWTNASAVSVVVYRGVTRLGNIAWNTGSSNSISFPSLTLQNTSGASWGLRFAGHRTATNLNINTPSNAPNSQVTALPIGSAAFDSNGGMNTNISSGTQSVNVGSGWVSATMELRGDEGVPAEELVDTFDGLGLDTSKWEPSSGFSGATLDGAGNLSLFGSGYLQSKSLLNLRDSSLVVGPVTVTAPTTFRIILTYDDANPLLYPSVALSVTPSGGDLVFMASNGIESETVGSYTGSFYTRMRESGGTLYIDLSSDGIDWTEVYDTPTYVPVDSTRLVFYSGAAEVLVGGVNPPPLEPLHKLKSSFRHLDTSKWVLSNADIIDNTLTATDPAGGTAISLATYDLNDSYALVEVPEFGSGTGLFVMNNAKAVGISIDLTGEVAGYGDLGAMTAFAIPDPLPRWLRLREDGGTLYYETSQNAASWTTLGSDTVSGLINPYGVQAAVMVGYNGEVNNFNIDTMPKTQTVTEDFEDELDPDMWVTVLGDGVEDGELVSSTIFSTRPYDISGSYVAVEVINPTVTLAITVDINPIINPPARFMTATGSTVSITDSDANTLWSGSASPAWLRIRESGGTLYYETSDDGTSWTTRYSESNTLDYIVLMMLATNGAADNLNSLPAPPGLPVKQYIGGSWVQIGVLKAYDGSNWVKPKYYNGSSWV